MSLSAKLVGAAPQNSGYQLLRYELSEAVDLPFNFQVEVQGHRLALFSQEQRNIAFLTEAPDLIAPEKLTIEIKNDQARSFLTDFIQEKLSDKPQTVCLLIKNEALASGFRLAQALKKDWSLVMILEGQQSFPFQIKPARFMFESLPPAANYMIGACSLLEDWGIPNRLCSDFGLPGCYDGKLDDFAQQWQAPANWKVITLSGFN